MHLLKTAVYLDLFKNNLLVTPKSGIVHHPTLA